MAASAAPISARRTRSARDDAPAARKGVAWPVFVFLLALLVPLIFGLGPVRLSAYRIVLLAMTIPLIFMLFSGKAGKIRFPDYALMTPCSRSVFVD